MPETNIPMPMPMPMSMQMQMQMPMSYPPSSPYLNSYYWMPMWPCIQVPYSGPFPYPYPYACPYPYPGSHRPGFPSPPS